MKIILFLMIYLVLSWVTAVLAPRPFKKQMGPARKKNAEDILRGL